MPNLVKYRVITQDQLQEEMGKRLADARNDAALSQTDVCKRLPALNMSKALLSNWENGRHPPPYIALTQLVQLYKRSVEWIVTGREPATGREDMSEEHYQQALILSRLPAHIKRFVELAIQYGDRAQGALHESLVAPPTEENWLAFAALLQAAATKKS